MTVIEQKIFCPLCDNPMRLDGDYYRCIANQLHACLIEKEWGRYKSGEKNTKWLAWRMKVRLGKLVRGKTMRLDRAIEIKLQWRKDNYPPPLADEINADNQSIEALKRIRAQRIIDPELHQVLLPGETEE